MISKIKGFSVAEAMMALLIGSVALGAAAPMITKQIKQNNYSDAQSQVINSKIERIIESNNEAIETLRREIEALKEADNGIPKGVVAFFNNEVEPESAKNPCPVGWTPINSSWAGRFPRFAGTHLILEYDATNKTYKKTGTEETLVVGATQEDAIRNMVGKRAVTSHYDGVGVFGLDDAFDGGWGYVQGSQLWGYIDFDASRVVPTEAENRPKAVALLGCVKK